MLSSSLVPGPNFPSAVKGTDMTSVWRCIAMSWGLLALMVGSVAAEASTASAEPVSDPIVTLIDEQIRAAWTDQKLSPSKPAPHGAWARRVYLDLLGRIPTVAEASDYATDRSENKREQLVDRLLGKEYRVEYARNMTTIWTNLLVGRTGGANNDSFVDRSGMQQYLRRAFQKNRPFDQMMEELVTAKGSCRPGDRDFDGAANFLADKMAENGIQATAQTAKLFLGTAVQCTQCHNHPFNEYKQNQFWELNAFFRQTKIERVPVGDNRRVARVLARDFRGEGGDPRKAEIYYELRNGKLKVAYPVFIDGTALADIYAEKGEDFGDRGYLSDIDRRQELATLIRASEEFPKAIVNRLWGHFFGYGLTKPVDDMGPHNPASHPELLDQLGLKFRESSFNLKGMMRAIVLSEAYSLDSRANRSNKQDDPTLGTKPMFTHFYLRQLTAEQLYESLLVATKADEGVSYDERERTKQRWLAQFNTAFGDDENNESTTFNGSIPQVLMMMNGQLIKQATSNEKSGMLYNVAWDSSLSNSDKINHLYIAALARKPDRNELAVCNQLLAAREGNVPAALQDVWWALLNSNEFILNH